MVREMLRHYPMDHDTKTKTSKSVEIADIPHMFERFYRAKGVAKTEGLGVGSTFYFSLPPQRR